MERERRNAPKVGRKENTPALCRKLGRVDWIMILLCSSRALHVVVVPEVAFDLAQGGNGDIEALKLFVRGTFLTCCCCTKPPKWGKKWKFRKEQRKVMQLAARCIFGHCVCMCACLCACVCVAEYLHRRLYGCVCCRRFTNSNFAVFQRFSTRHYFCRQWMDDT